MQILYDPSIFAPANPTYFTANTDAFPALVEGPIASNGAISAVVSIGSDTTKAVQQPTKVATIQFKALQRTNSSAISFGGNTEIFSVAVADDLRENVVSTTIPASIAVGDVITPTPVTQRITLSSDDAEQDKIFGLTFVDSSNLNFGGTIVGMRFQNLPIPKDATITSAFIEVNASTSNSGPTLFTIIGENSDDAVTFTETFRNISSRPQTTARVAWDPLVWDTQNPLHQTPDISEIIREITSRAGWASGNDLVITVTGSGSRQAWSYDGDPAKAPLLSITYESPSSCTAPPPPTNLSFSCGAEGRSATASWDPVSSATSYKLYVDNTTDGYGNECLGQGGDFCQTGTSTSRTYDINALEEYIWKVESANACGSSSTTTYRQNGTSCAPQTWGISGPTQITLGQTATFSANYISDYGTPTAQIVAGQNGTIVWNPTSVSYPTSVANEIHTRNFSWTPTAPGTYDVFSIARNGVVECWGNPTYTTLGGDKYSCENSGAYIAKMTLTVVGSQVTPTITVPTNTPFPTATPIPPNHTSVALSLKLHGIGLGGDNLNPTNPGNQNPLTPQRIVSLEIYNRTGALVTQENGTITFNSATGIFTGIVDLGTSFTTDDYTLKLKTNKYLRRLIPGIHDLVATQQYSAPQVALVVGDVNGDNALNIVDYSLIIDCYSVVGTPRACEDQAKKAQMDINDDGKVDGVDYNLFLRELLTQSGD